MTREVFPTPGSAGPSSAPHGCPTALPALPSRLALLLPLSAVEAAFVLGARTAAGADSQLVYTHTHSQKHTHTHTQSLCHAWLSPARPTPPGSAMWPTGLFRRELAKVPRNRRAWTGEVELEPRDS